MGLFDTLGDVASGAVSAAGSAWDALNNVDASSVGLNYGPFRSGPSPEELQRLLAQYRAAPPEQQPALAEQIKARAAESPGVGNIFQSLLPPVALDAVGSIPVVGGEAERMLSGLTSPVGIVGAAAGAGLAGSIAPLIFGTVAGAGGGLAGQAAEKAGLPDLPIPTPWGDLHISPQMLGEVGGGLLTGNPFKSAPMSLDNAAEDAAREAALPKIGEPSGVPTPPDAAATTPVTSGVQDAALAEGVRQHLDTLSNVVQNANDLGVSLDPNIQNATFHLASQVGDEPLTALDTAAQVQGGDLTNPYMPTAKFGDAIEAIGKDRIGEGPLSWMPKPLTVITNRASRGLALQASGPDFVALNAADMLDRFANSAGMQAQALSVGERKLGLLTREPPTVMGGVVEFFRPGIDLPTTDQPILGLAPSAKGVVASIDNFESGAYPRAELPQPVRNFIDAYSASVTSIRNDSIAALVAKGMSRADAEVKFPLTEVPSGGFYFHRIPINSAGDLMGAVRKGVGATQDIARERVVGVGELPTNVKYLGSFAASLKNYADEAGKVVADQTYTIPMLKQMGVDPGAMVPADFSANVAQAKSAIDWYKSARQLTKDANQGRPVTAIQQRAQALAQTAPSEEARASILRLTAPFAQQSGQSVPEAVLKGQADIGTVQRETQGFADMNDAVKTTDAELASMAQGAKSDHLFAKDQLKLATRRMTNPGFTTLDMQKFPGMAGQQFDRNTAQQIQDAFARSEPPAGLISAVNQYQGLLQAMQVNTVSMGHVGLHLTSMMTPTTWRFIPTVLKDMWTNDGYLGAVEKFKNIYTKDGTSVYDHMQNLGIPLGTEVTDPLSLMNRPAGITKALAEFIGNTPLNRTFTRSINLARMAHFAGATQLVEAITKRPATAEELATIGRNAGMVTGDFGWARAGIGQTQRAGERVSVFAPTWLRSQINLIATAATPSMGLAPDLARLTLGSEIAGLVGIYSATAVALGQTLQLSPVKLDGSYNPDFLTVQVGGVKVGPSGPILSLVRTAAQMGTLAGQAATGDAGALQKLVDLRDSGNPLNKFWRGHAATLSGILYDTAVLHHQAYGDNKALGFGSNEEAKASALNFIESLAPFGVKEAVDQGPVSAAAQFVGGRQMPLSAPETFMESANQKAHELKFSRWADIPAAEQANIIRNDANLTDLKAKQDAYFSRFGSPTDAAYATAARSHQLVEDSALAAWGAVQAGTMDIATFRKAFGDLMAKHAYLTNQTFDAAGIRTSATGQPPQKSNETDQDYWARLYHAIQPSDSTGTGTPSEADWKQFQDARANFWQQFPGAANFQSYITTQYETKQWKSPEMAQVAGQLYTAQNGYTQFLAIPKYRGLSASDATLVDQLRAIKGRVETEANFKLAQGGAPNRNVSAHQAWQIALATAQQAGVHLSPNVVRYAIALDGQRARATLVNPQRMQFLEGNPEVPQFYPGAWSAAGLTSDQLARLGLEQAPSGTPATALATRLAA